MEKQELYKELASRILKIFDKFGNEIPFNTVEFRDYKSKYSSTGKDAMTIFIDGIPTSNMDKKKYRVDFQCSCGNIQNVLLKKYMVKEKISCTVCKEHGEKAEWQRLMFAMAREGKVRGNKPPRSIYNVVYDFENESEEFKKEYFEKHLTEEEFNKYGKYIYSVDDVVIEGRDDVIYLPHEPSKNAKKYTGKISIGGEIHGTQNLRLRCPLCGEVFHITRQLKEKVKNNNFDCKYCSFVNKTFKIRKYNGLNYQSSDELNFIKLCEKYNICIQNGDKIPYVYKNKTYTYIIDFKLPDLKYNIEIKDNHIWHREQVESGKWQAKFEYANQHSKEQGFIYKVLFPDEIESFVESLLKR